MLVIAFNTFNYVKELIWWCLWVLRYACVYVDWVVFYVLYEKLRIHVVLESLRKACDYMSCISVKACTQSIMAWEHEHVTKSWMINARPWFKGTLAEHV
jgi:hypothetical protein